MLTQRLIRVCVLNVLNVSNVLNEKKLTVRAFNCCLTHSEKDDDVVKSSETYWWCR